MTGAFVRSTTSMGTVVTAHVVGHSRRTSTRADSAARALDWFDRVERACSRFDPASELSRLSARVGEAVRVSDLLYEIVRLAVATAEETDGAFDPTVGHVLETAGFDREHRTGERIQTPPLPDTGVSYRDIRVDNDEKTLILARPLILDLGGIAKGFAVDLAARELRNDGLENFVIDAGGDLYLAGHNANDEPWSVGIRHPRDDRATIETLRVSDAAVCTSGDYERIAAAGSGTTTIAHHLIDPRTKQSATNVASVTVCAPTAAVADSLATAAFVLGPVRGVELLRRQGVNGIIITPTLERFSTAA